MLDFLRNCALVSVSFSIAVLALPLSAFADTTEEGSSETSAIQSNETTNPNTGFSPEEKVSAEEMELLNQMAPTISNVNEIDSNAISIRAAVMSYTLDSLSIGGTKLSNGSFVLPAGSKPTITLVQSPYINGNGTVDVYY